MTVPRLLDPAESTHEVTTAICEAFADYPVMRYVMGDIGDYYATRLRTLITFSVASRVLRRDAILAVSTGSEVSGVALCTLPGLRWVRTRAQGTTSASGRGSRSSWPSLTST